MCSELQVREEREKFPFGHVPSDVCDPMHIKTLGGLQRFVIFIDDPRRLCFLYTLKS